MALIVEDGSGLSTSDSYTTVSFIDTYNSSYNSDALWLNAQTNTKERAVRIATQWLDVNFGDVFGGQRTETDQALCFPRINLLDNQTNYYVDSDSIPLNLQQATAIIAIQSLSEDIWDTDYQINSGVNGGAPIKRQKDKVDTLETETEYAVDVTNIAYQSKLTNKNNKQIQNLLGRYTNSRNTLRRG